MDTVQARHIEIMRDFLTELNKETDAFILKGGTGLLLAYGLNRFSEDIDLILDWRLLGYSKDEP